MNQIKAAYEQNTDLLSPGVSLNCRKERMLLFRSIIVCILYTTHLSLDIFVYFLPFD